MKSYIIYVCEKCGKESVDKNTIAECEASHYGLTVAEMQEWEAIKKKVSYASYTVNTTKNRQTDTAFDNAIEELISFEKTHGLCE